MIVVSKRQPSVRVPVLTMAERIMVSSYGKLGLPASGHRLDGKGHRQSIMILKPLDWYESSFNTNSKTLGAFGKPILVRALISEYMPSPVIANWWGALVVLETVVREPVLSGSTSPIRAVPGNLAFVFSGIFASHMSAPLAGTSWHVGVLLDTIYLSRRLR